MADIFDLGSVFSLLFYHVFCVVAFLGFEIAPEAVSVHDTVVIIFIIVFIIIFVIIISFAIAVFRGLVAMRASA